jgi:hypothetical protein
VTISASWPASADQTHMWTFDATLPLPRICLSFTYVAGSEAAPKQTNPIILPNGGSRP